MNRAFISLYLIIVLSIILLGLVLNKFWDEVNPPLAVDPAVTDLMSIIEMSLDGSQDTEKKNLLQKITSNSRYKTELVSILNFSKTGIAEKIKQGDVVSINDDQTHYFYKRVKNSDDVLMLSAPIEPEARNGFYTGFILLFYSAIAGTVFLWVWPLTRDLARLASHAQQLGKDGQQNIINISTRSVLYPFAKIFNAMAERLNEMMRSQKEMTLAVSHELRTPLARMKFALAITQDENLPAPMHRQLTNINNDILDMESLINSFLAYASFEQQSQQLNQREGHINDLIQDIINRALNHEQTHIMINVFDETQGRVVVCEWSLMQTAIQNLIHNALGYAKTTIQITTKIQSNYFVIEIDDDGPGVAQEMQTQIFESFVRIYSEVTNRSGFGLGLALVKRIMDWHLGTVKCTQSSLGGAKFILQWPQ
ncbi:MAG: two-component sensor histidine kinase [Gammaproteobacteria bacterium]|nr:MAG: two-component sensor histidine kinase [Gammaproteobacteria bacterium]